MVVDNQYVLNDRRRPGSIFVTGITGLTGADVVVGAEKNADRDGETPNDGTYGGRTVSLKGFVRGGDLEDMRYLYSYLMDSFDDLIERQFWFQWLDWRDEFLDTYSLIDYSFDSGSGTVAVALDGSGLQPTSTALKSMQLYPVGRDGLTPTRYTYGDGEAIVAFRVASSYTSIDIGVECRRSAANNKLVINYTPGNVSVTRIIGGAFSVTSTAATVPAAGDLCFLRVRAEGSLVSWSTWGYYPPDVGGIPLSSGSYTLTPTELLSLPPVVSGRGWGLRWRPNSVDDRVELLEVGALNKGDGVIYCRKASTIDGEEVQTEDGWKRDFMVTLRASDPRIVSRKVSTVSIVPSGFALAFPGGGGGLTFPADGSGLVFGAYLPSPVVNLGARGGASMIVRFYGAIANPVLLDPTTGRSVGLNLTIADGDYVEVNTFRRTVFDSSGNSIYKFLTDETNWPEIDGSVRFILGADSVSGSGRIEISYRHSSR